MRRWYIGLLGSLLLLGFWAAAVGAQPADVPPSHWAYRAVQTMVDRGYMDTDPTGAFNGSDAAQRFDVAAAVAGLLEDVEAGRIRVASGADTEMLRALEQEFRAELVQWYSERDRLEAAHAQTQRHMAVINEQLGMLLIALDDLQDAVRADLEAGLRAEALRTDGRFEQTDRRLDAAEGRLDELGFHLDTLRDDFDIFSLNTSDRFDTLTDDVNDKIGFLQASVDEALRQFGEATGVQLDRQGGALASLQQSLDSLQATVAEHGEELDDLASSTANRFVDLEAGWFARFSQLQTDLDGLAADLTALAALGEELTEGLADAQEDVRHTQHLLLDFVIELRGELEALQGQTAALQTQIRELVSDFVALRTQLTEVQSRVGALEGDVAALHAEVGDLRSSVDGVEAAVGSLRGDVDGLQSELSDLHDVLGTSEEQIARMTDRVRVQLEDQLALSLAREQRLERQLTELRSEFDSYKAQMAEELKSARNMGSLALGAAALAILLGLTN